MKPLILMVCFALLGCGGAVELDGGADAGQNGTRSGSTNGTSPEQQLSNSLPTWCPQICAQLSQCLVSSSCVSECNASVQEFLGHGDACAQFGLDFMSCLNNATCNDVLNGNGQLCDPYTTAESNACGSGSVDASTATSNPTGSAVSCQSGSGSASTGSTPIGSTVCDSSLSDCSDGHVYSINCLNAGNDQLACTCYRDKSSGASFVTTGTSCPTGQAVNSYCGWQLSGM